MKTDRDSNQAGDVNGITDLKRLLYSPKYSSDPDRALDLLNSVSGRPRPLRHADIDLLGGDEAAALAVKLRPLLADRSAGNIARAKRKLFGG